MQHITSQQLEQLLRKGEDLALLDVLPPTDYAKEHIPNSTNIPVEQRGFETTVEKRLGGKNKKIVVYCASKECPASMKAAQQLERAGFRNVYEFDGGIKEWKETGHKTTAGPA